MARSPTADRLLAESAWLHRLARSLVGDELAPDLEQDVAVAVLSRPASLRFGRAWLATVARNLASSLRRRQCAEERRLGSRPVREPAVAAAELVATAELQQRAVAAVLALPPAYRDTLLQRFLQGATVQATAAAMGVPAETVRTRQRRALGMLREQLAPPPRKQERSLLAAPVIWSSAMKAKHVVVTGVAVLLSLCIGVVCWSRCEEPLPEESRGAPGVASSELEQAPSDASHEIAASTSSANQRTEALRSTEVEVSTGSIVVQVSWDDTRQPVGGVAVLCRPGAETGAFAQTDSDGVVRFGELSPGAYRIQTHDWRTTEVAIAAGEERELQVRLARGTTATGLVVDEELRPVANAHILVSAGGTRPQWSFPATVSDAGGRFRLAGLRNFALLGARHDAHGVTDFRLIQGAPPDGSAHQVRLQFRGTQAVLRGHVTDDEGQPVAGAWVKIGGHTSRMQPDDDGHLYRAPLAQLTTTDAGGNFEAAGLRPGERRLFVYRQGHAPHRQVVAVRSGEANDVHVVLAASAGLRGIVTDYSGAPVAGATVDLATYSYPETGSTETDAQGRFRFTHLSAGEVEFQVRAKGLASARRSVQVVGGHDQDCEVVLAATAMIRGRLSDHHGSALANWWIGVRSAQQRAKTDAQGRFAIAAGAEQETVLVRARAGFAPVVAVFADLAASEHEHQLVIGPEHAATARFRGRLVDADGAPLAGVEVTLSQERWPVIPEGGEIQTAADGTFVSGPLPPGSYEVAPMPGRYLVAPVGVELRRDATHDCGTLRGALPASLRVELTGAPAAVGRATVTLHAGGRKRIPRGRGASRSFTRVLPGSYEMVVRLGDRECHREQVVLEPGSALTRTCDVR